jgi:serine/threonine protein kinase
MIGSKVSHYQIVEEIGRGGMGVVYRARDTRLDRSVALKFLPLHVSLSKEAEERFTREAQTAAKTEHPNVCGVFDIGESDDGRRFIAMPLHDADDLAEQSTTNIASFSGGLDPLDLGMTDLYILRASPDGRYLAFQRREEDSEDWSLWLHDVERGSLVD